MLTKIYNGRILRDHALVEDATLWIEDGRILDGAETFWQAQRAPDRTIDASGGIICPGFIDLQVNGAFGVDFSQVTETYEQGLDRVSTGLLHHGCTSYCPTLVSSHPAVYHQVLPKLAPRKGSLERGAEILGAHVEGPFICPDRRGAHDPATLRTARHGLDDLYACYGQEGFTKSVRIITMAPDVDGVIDTIPQVAAQGIVVSEGHSNASTAQAEEGVRRGAGWITHLFNAMQQFHHRDPGLVGLLGSPVPPQRPHYGLICDGIHVHPNSIKVAYYAHPRGAVLVTDAMAALGLEPGIYALGAMRVEKHADRAYLEGTTTLAGNVITMIESVQNFKKFTKCTVVEALEAATLHPAEVLNITHRKGTLQPGADADILILSDDLEIQRVFVAGDEVPLTKAFDG